MWCNCIVNLEPLLHVGRSISSRAASIFFSQQLTDWKQNNCNWGFKLKVEKLVSASPSFKWTAREPPERIVRRWLACMQHKLHACMPAILWPHGLTPQPATAIINCLLISTISPASYVLTPRFTAPAPEVIVARNAVKSGGVLRKSSPLEDRHFNICAYTINSLYETAL